MLFKEKASIVKLFVHLFFSLFHRELRYQPKIIRKALMLTDNLGKYINCSKSLSVLRDLSFISNRVIGCKDTILHIDRRLGDYISRTCILPVNCLCTRRLSWDLHSFRARVFAFFCQSVIITGALLLFDKF